MFWPTECFEFDTWQRPDCYSRPVCLQKNKKQKTSPSADCSLCLGCEQSNGDLCFSRALILSRCLVQSLCESDLGLVRQALGCGGDAPRLTFSQEVIKRLVLALYIYELIAVDERGRSGRGANLHLFYCQKSICIIFLMSRVKNAA